MPLGNITLKPQEIHSHLSNHISDTALCINSGSVLSIENSSGKFIGDACLENKSMDELEDPIYINMRKDVTCVSNSYEISYDKTSNSHFFNKSLLINNKKNNSFLDLNNKEKNLIFDYLKNKEFDMNKLLKFSNNKSINEPIEESIYETMEQSYFLKEKLELIDDLSKIIYKNNKVNGDFKDNLIKSIFNIPLEELFSPCERYEEFYEIQDSFLINRFIYQFIDDFNK